MIFVHVFPPFYGMLFLAALGWMHMPGILPDGTQKKLPAYAGGIIAFYSRSPYAGMIRIR